MSLNDQLIDDMTSLMISNPESILKIINGISISKYPEYKNRLNVALRMKCTEIEFYDFCQLNGYTSEIVKNDLNIGEQIIMLDELTFASVVVIENKIDEEEYNGIILPHCCFSFLGNGICNTTNLQGFNNLKNVRFCDSTSTNVRLTYHDNSWGIYGGLELEGCNCDKIKCFRKPLNEKIN